MSTVKTNNELSLKVNDIVNKELKKLDSSKLIPKVKKMKDESVIKVIEYSGDTLKGLFGSQVDEAKQLLKSTIKNKSQYSKLEKEVFKIENCWLYVDTNEEGLVVKIECSRWATKSVDDAERFYNGQDLKKKYNRA